jgi:hypothetical protein
MEWIALIDGVNYRRLSLAVQVTVSLCQLAGSPAPNASTKAFSAEVLRIHLW